MLVIPAESQKNGKEEMLPMSPEFAEFLLARPEAQRVGSVFRDSCPGRGTAGLARSSPG